MEELRAEANFGCPKRLLIAPFVTNIGSEANINWLSMHHRRMYKFEFLRPLLVTVVVSTPTQARL